MGRFISCLLLLVVLLNLPSESTGCKIPEICIQCRFDWCASVLGRLGGYEVPTVECALQNWPLDTYMKQYDVYYNNAMTDCVKGLLEEELDYLKDDMNEFVPWAVAKNFTKLVQGTADRFHQSVHRLRTISTTYSGQFRRGFIGTEKYYSTTEINTLYRKECCLSFRIPQGILTFAFIING